MRTVSACSSFAALLLVMTLAVFPAAAEVIAARYAVTLVGFNIGEASAHGAVSAAAYRVALDAHLTGLAEWLAHMRIALASSGEIRRGSVLPNAYATTAASERSGSCGITRCSIAGKRRNSIPMPRAVRASTPEGGC